MRQGRIMKKLILLFAITLGIAVNTAYAEITFSHQTGTYPGYYPQTAMKVEDEGAIFQPAVVFESGTDIVVTIFAGGKNFAVEKQFTIYINADMELESLYIQSIHLREITVTKNFFVKNGKWCVAFSNEEGRIIVIDEEGNILGTLPECEFSMEIFLDGLTYGNPYLIVRDENGIYSLCSFTNTAESGIKSAKVNSVTSAYPNPLPAGATFTVNFEQPADDATFFSVLDMKGRQVYCRRVKPGDNSFRLSGTRFGHGHYIYTIVYKDGNSVTGRLMAE